MTRSVPEERVGPPELCPLCQGPWSDGRIAVPVAGSLRFIYRLGTEEVAAEVTARACTNCGHLVLQARAPDRVGPGRTPGKVGPPRRWVLSTHRQGFGYRSRYG